MKEVTDVVDGVYTEYENVIRERLMEDHVTAVLPGIVESILGADDFLVLLSTFDHKLAFEYESGEAGSHFGSRH